MAPSGVKYIERFKYHEYEFEDPIKVSQNAGQPEESYTVCVRLFRFVPQPCKKKKTTPKKHMALVLLLLLF